MHAASPTHSAPSEELAPIDEPPYNEYRLTPVLDTHYTDGVPQGGFTGKMAKSSTASALKALLVERLGVPTEGISLVYEGKELEDSATLRENGIVEPGPAARRSGAKIHVRFAVSGGVELATVRLRRLEAERLEREAQEHIAAERQARRAAAEAKIREDNASAEAEAAETARARDGCTLRCAPLGGATGQPIATTFSASVAEFSEQLKREMGMVGGGEITLMFNDQVMPSRASLREIGVANQSEVVFFLACPAG